MKKIFYFLFFLFFSSAFLNAQEPTEYISIQGAAYQRIPLSVEADREIPRKLVSILKKNLLWSGVFEMKKKEDSKINLEIIEGINNNVVANFTTYQNEPLFSYTLKREQNSQKQEQEIIDFVQKVVVKLTQRKSSLGSAILYSEQVGRDPKRIVVTDTHNKIKKNLVTDRNYNILSRWSPKEDSFIYTSIGRKGSRIMILDLKKKTRKIFIRSRFGTAVGGSWNPQNNDIVVTLSNRVNHDLYLFNKRGNFLSKLTQLSSIDTSPAFSPNGKFIAFTSNRSGSVQLYSLDLENKRKKRISFNGSYNADPKWSKDGSHLLYAGRRGKYFQIFLMNFYSNQIKQLTYSRKTSENPTWSPDNRLIVFSSKISGESKLYIMTVDGKYTRRLTRSPKGVKETNPDWATDTPWKYLK